MSKQFSLVKQQRINQAKRFRELSVAGKLVLKLDGVSWYLDANQEGCARLAIIIPKKLVSLAVERNYLKRLIRNAFRLHQSCFVACDLLVRVSGTMVTRALIDEGFSKLSGVKIPQVLFSTDHGVPTNS